MLDPAQKEAFWPETAAGWVGLVGAALGVLAGAAVVLGWVWPWIRRRLRVASWQDIRVHVTATTEFTGVDMIRGADCLRIKVENHSDQDFYLHAITVHEGGKDGSGLMIERDYATGRQNTDLVVKPRDSTDFYIPIEALGKKPERYRFAVAHDKIGREYRSPRGHVTKVLAEVAAANAGPLKGIGRKPQAGPDE